VLADHTVSARVPFAVDDPAFVARERYLDPGFAALERDRLWPRVWQMACRLDEIPSAGDFAEYVIGDQSILVVRVSATEIRAFFNACRHRATELAKGAGTFSTGQIVCPFHGWRWRLDGTNAGVYGRPSFRDDLLEPSELCLRECRVGTWGGGVWVNLDPEAPPLLDALAPMPSLLDPLGLDRMRVRWWKSVVLRANWKLAQEAFMEGYHVMQTHPQLTLGKPQQADPDSLEYSVHANGHSSFQNRAGGSRRAATDVDAVLESARLLYTGLDAMTLARDLHVLEGLRRKAVPEGSSFGAEMVKAWYEHMTTAGVPVPPPDPAAIARWGGVFFCFPNFFVLPQYANALLYRVRPHGPDPESCLFELWSVTIPADGDELPRPVQQGPFAPDDDEAWPLIPLQDFSNIERQQRGLHSRSFAGMRLSSTYEAGIANMHRHLDGYLDG
jgi:phenylpropionate dioxygenase-like ring-hydroxylating dioxygenase large terminal subunit